ncbi:MAG: hypothetical protein LBK95_08845 [Bifidobacteriaceae bacterium]|nr:hypothetical protein [Bifidobacteriaceae bacterium]
MSGAGDGRIHVAAVFWDDHPQAVPEVLAGRDQDDVTLRAARMVWDRTALKPDPSDEAAAFMRSRPAPSEWSGAADARQWLAEAAAEGFGPRVIPGRAPLADDDEPDRDRDVTIGLVRGWDEPPLATLVLADLEPLRLEARLADAVWARARGLGQDHPAPPSPPDAGALWRWLTDAKGGLEGVVAFSAQQAPLPAAQPVPDTAAAEAAGPGQAVIDTGRPAVWADLNSGGIPDRLIAALPDPPAPFGEPGSAKQVGGREWEAAMDDWREDVLDVAADISRVADLRDRVDQLEYLWDRLAREVAGHPLPAPPEDRRLVGQWLAQFADTAVERDRRLLNLVDTTRPDGSPPHTAPTVPARRPEPAQQPDTGTGRLAPRHAFGATPTNPAGPAGLRL